VDLNGLHSGLPEPATVHGASSLLPLVYQELRAAAGRLMASERSDHTLQPTALVHEAYVRLAKAGARFKTESHFFYAAAQAMRRILVDHALARGCQKRGGREGRKAELNDANVSAQEPQQLDWLALDEAIDKLSAVSPRQAQVVMLRFFGGLSDAQIAQTLQVSPTTVRRDWATARPWLYRQMQA
jgi:RNA polymerase sigma factor (TIGR02999 family)